MDDREKEFQIKKIYIALAEYYRVTITPEQLRMYAEDLMDLSPSEIVTAVKRVRQNPSRKFLPLPAELVEEVRGRANDDCLDATNRIVEAMSRFGYTNGERAREHIGELGWLVVQREGGWQSLCERTQSEDLPILKAQWREMAKALRGRAVRGVVEHPPALFPIGTGFIKAIPGGSK